MSQTQQTDEEIAKQLQKQFDEELYEQQKKYQNEEVTNSNQTDGEIAKQLQQQFDEELYEEDYQEEEELKDEILNRFEFTPKVNENVNQEEEVEPNYDEDYEEGYGYENYNEEDYYEYDENDDNEEVKETKGYEYEDEEEEEEEEEQTQQEQQQQLEEDELLIGKQDLLKVTSKMETAKDLLYSGDGSIGKFDTTNYFTQKVTSEIIETSKKSEKKRNRKDKDQSTSESMDKGTRILLTKFVSQGKLEEINGCVATGKESFVFHGTCPGYDDEKFNIDFDAQDVAIKVFKTATLGYKDRQKYFTGEFRFKGVKYSHNPRRLAKLWAEKEFRNLKKMQKHGINCPTAMFLKNNVVVMSFVGKQSTPAPRLKDLKGVTTRRWRQLYRQMICSMRVMYQKVELVHADLSEYNILYSQKKAVIIDVSQSIHSQTENALEFLRKDCWNITKFFKSKGVKCWSVRELFGFVTSLSINSNNLEPFLEEMQRIVDQRDPKDSEMIEKDSLFMKAFIPKSLSDLDQEETEQMSLNYVERILKGETSEMFYGEVMGLKKTLDGIETQPEILKNLDLKDNDKKKEDQEEKEEKDEKEEKEKEEEEEEEKEINLEKEIEIVSKKKKQKGRRGETSEEKKIRKQLLKQQKRENRGEKLPKKEKKQLVKKNKRKK
ncbi:serine/threonine-protein kinase rio1 [Anaeramoeba flamelloides]|uniref:non-specific serine/threonine protein kinase n=1 Tax=Anaeramoeba flamelloides TaxID=1746091 RepID=A0ABQ8X7U8_9EUKA|nr:serine/threonine-protein kinase rio1 [Anaeramoeba flamelloides]